MAKKRSDFERKRAKMLLWGYIFSGVAFVIFGIFVIRIFVLQNTDVENFRENYIEKYYREATLKAARGNIYFSDGSIMATTVMQYNIYVDFKLIKDALYQGEIGALSDSLSAMFGKSSRYFKARIDQQKKTGNRYYTLAKGLDFDQYKRIRTFPILGSRNQKTGEYNKNRCLIVDRSFKRILPASHIGIGTAGVDHGAFQSGFEGAFSKYLRGRDGTRLEQRINAFQWKPIDYWKVKDPVDGENVYTTIDLRIQDIARSSLQNQLINFDADHGSVVIMEVATGKVKAAVNLRKIGFGNYADAYNYLIKDAFEPGSIFKVVSMLAAIEDNFVNADTKVDIGEPLWIYGNQRITNPYPGKIYGLDDILAKSSNVGIAKIITESYENNPWIFIDHLKKWKMDEKMNIELPGITVPFIVTPSNKRWNKATLASLSFGYSSRYSLLQLATFYNGIANGGKMLKPLFIDRIEKEGKFIYESRPEVMVDKMASSEAITLMTKMLVKAVEKGTARSIFTPNLKLAGKTGTARFEYWKSGPMKYQASFAGFFPADDPKYTCLVMINQPDSSKGFSGTTVSAPVFKEIAGKIFLKTPLNMDERILAGNNIRMSKKNPHKQLKIVNHKIPDLKGMSGKTLIPDLENMGYIVDYKGVGVVLDQFPKAGTVIDPSQKIYLNLSN